MPRIYAYVETAAEQRDEYRPQPKELAAGSGDWIEEVFNSLVLNVKKVDGEDPTVTAILDKVVEDWLDREPTAFRALLATNFRSERARYLQELEELLVGPTLYALAVHVPD